MFFKDDGKVRDLIISSSFLDSDYVLVKLMRILSLLYVFQKILAQLLGYLLVYCLLLAIVGLFEQTLIVTLFHFFLSQVFCLL